MRVLSHSYLRLTINRLTSEYSESEGNRIAKDLAISVRAIMFSSYFASSPCSPDELYSDLDGTHTSFFFLGKAIAHICACMCMRT
jgi:hypothetical protein